MDGELTDITTGEEERAHDVGIGRERELRAHAVDAKSGGIVHAIEQRIREARSENPFDQIVSRFAAAAMAERNALISQVELMAPDLAHPLDLIEHLVDSRLLRSAILGR